MNEIEKDVWKIFQRMGNPYGLSDLITKVMAVLYMQIEDIPMEMLAEKTGYSLASISTALKRLENLGIIQRKRKPGSKKVFVYMEKNLARLNIQKLRTALEHYIRPARAKMPEIIEKHKGKNNKDQLQLLEAYSRQLEIFEQVMEKWKQDLEDVSHRITREIL